MKTLYVTFLVFSLGISAKAQTSKQEGKKQKKEAQYQKVKEVIASKNYQFIARYALPQKGRQIDLSSRANSLKIIDNEGQARLSYFGEVHGGGSISGDTGINFDAQLEDFKVVENDKKSRVIITFRIKGKAETYNCTLEARSLESTSLSMSSNQRQFIRYTGTLSVLLD